MNRSRKTVPIAIWPRGSRCSKPVGGPRLGIVSDDDRLDGPFERHDRFAVNGVVASEGLNVRQVLRGDFGRCFRFFPDDGDESPAGDLTQSKRLDAVSKVYRHQSSHQGGRARIFHERFGFMKYAGLQ